jgi:hypothetical protein
MIPRKKWMQDGGRGLHIARHAHEGHTPLYVVMRELLKKHQMFFVNDGWVTPLYSNLFLFMDQDEQGRYIFTDAAFRYVEREIRNLIKHRNYLHITNLKTLGRAVYMQHKYKWMWQRSVLEAQMLYELNQSLSELNAEMASSIGKIGTTGVHESVVAQVRARKRAKKLQMQKKQRQHIKAVQVLQKAKEQEEEALRISLDFDT